MKNFSCFPKQFFFSNSFNGYVQYSFDRPTKHFLRNYRKWSKKMSTKDAKFFQDIFFGRFPWRGRKQLQNLLKFFRQSDEIFPLGFQKITNCKLCREKNFSTKVSFGRENPVLTKTPRFSLENPERLSVNVRRRLEE